MKCVGLSELSELSFAGGQSTFHVGTIGIAIKGAPSTLCVCEQGSRRLFKSGPLEEAIKCERPKRGRAQEGGGYFPIAAVGGLVPPREFFEHFYVRYNRVFLRFFMHLGPDFSCFGHNLLLERYFLSHEKPNSGKKLFSDSHDFFSAACSFDTFSSMSWHILAKYF